MEVAILGAGAKEEGGGGRRGGSSTSGYTKLDEGKSINWGVVIGILVIGFALLGIAAYIVRMYTPEHPCPSEEICEQAWTEIKAQGDAIDGNTLRKYHNCRIRHRAQGIKPSKFRPRCEGYCAYVTREAETPGLPPNPLKWLFCLKDLFKGGDDEEGGMTRLKMLLKQLLMQLQKNLKIYLKGIVIINKFLYYIIIYLCKYADFCKSLNGETLSFDVRGSMLIEELKFKIQEKVGIFPYNQLLNFSGKILRNDKKIEDYKIKKSTIHLSLNLRGGLILTTLAVVAVGAAIYGAAKNDATTKNTVITNVVNDFTQEIQTELKNSNRATSNASQVLKINADYARMLRCRLSVSQDQEVELRATMDAMTELNETQTAELATLITNAQEAAIEQANAGLNVPGTENESELDNEVRNNINNNLSMSINKTFENMNYTKSEAVQEAYIDLWGLACKDSSILIDQKQAIKVFSENLSETIVDTLQTGEISTDIHNEQTQSVKQKNEGFGASGSASLIGLFILSGIITVITAVVSKVGGGEGDDAWWYRICKNRWF